MEKLNNLIEIGDIWDDQKEAQSIMQERSNLENSLNVYSEIKNELNEISELIDLYSNESQSSEELEEEILASLTKLSEDAELALMESMLSGEADSNSAYLEFHPGAGGTESQDWAQMLLRMYSRWGEGRGYKIEAIEFSAGDEAGIKSATLKVIGKNAYGWLKTESGIHRLVRISPFDSQKRRHTSFASVWVYPEIDDNIEVDFKESDCRIDTYRSSGAGGQHVNTTDSAVRITHVPTNIVVQCQSQRSQHKNKSTALSMLRARLYELELQKKEEKTQEILDTKSEIGWGHQIRSYVLQPYQMVKDLRTNVEDGNIQAVLDGRIDKFLTSALSSKIS